MAGYLAAEEEDPGEAGGGDAAPDDDGGGEQRPVAVDHRRRRSFAPGAADRSMGDWRRRRGERGIGPSRTVGGGRKARPTYSQWRRWQWSGSGLGLPPPPPPYSLGPG